MRLFHIACLLQAYRALADLPVHCLVDDVAGSWEFALGPSAARRGSCGHRRPDDPMHEPLVAEGSRDNPLYSKLAVELLPGGAARVGDQQGSWRMVSDEAVEVTGGNVELLAFLGFEQLPADNGGDHLPLSLQRRHSRCGETVLGWYNKDNRAEWGCWYGRRAAGSFLQLGAAGGARVQRHLRQAFPGERSIADVDAGGWDLPGLSLSAWSSDVVKRRSPVTDGIDWRNVSGSRWVDAPLVQGHCGSCYAAAAVQMLSARHRIASGDPSLEGFSVSFPLYCGEYTEGCRGGYPFLAAKWSQDVGLVPESCAPYAAEGSCGLKCTREQLGSKGRYRAIGHRYVTGGEDSIIEELRRGPVAVSFRSEAELQDYTGGVWEPPPLDDEAREGGFVAPTHSSLLVGYGVDTSSGESVPYWRLQNTWGSEWGENGTFRIRRDLARERGIETLVVAADVVQEDRPEIVDELVEAAQPAAGEVLISVSASREAVRGHRGEPVCREEPSGAGDEAVVVRLDREHNFRGLSFGDSAGTETAVQCAGATPDGCATVPAGQPIPPCSEVETCPCDLHGRPLPYPGMQALAEPVVNMCSSSSGAARVLLIGLGGGAISSYLFDRCPSGRLILENVEKDGRVAGLASKFFGFAEGSANTIQVTDGLSAVQSKDKGQYDAIMVDCFAGKDRVPLGCRSEEFYRSARALLKADGLLLQNVWGRSSASEEVVADFNATVDALGAAFERAPSKEVVFDAPQSLEYILYGLQGTQWSSLLPVDGST